MRCHADDSGFHSRVLTSISVEEERLEVRSVLITNLPHGAGWASCLFTPQGTFLDVTEDDMGWPSQHLRKPKHD